MLGLALVVAATAGSTGAFAKQAAVVLPEGGTWGDSASGFRGQTGKRFTFLCPADGTPERAWGTDIYTDDSSVCTAAMHTGKLKPATGGLVTIEMRPGEASYNGTTRNGVTTVAYGSWSDSYVVVSVDTGGAPAGVKIGGSDWTATAVAHRGNDGDRYRYVCQGGGTAGTVWGVNVYTDDSSVCTAAVQVGAITAAAGGNVTIEIRPGQKAYVGFAHNGVTSRSYSQWSGSFVLAGAAQIPGSPSGTPGGGGSTTTTTSSGSAAPPPTATTTGTVLVNGQPFTAGTIPYGATVDVTKGSVLLKADTGTLKVNGAGGITAAFVLKRATDGKKAVVELRLAKGDFGVCPKRKTSSAREAAAATTVRQLWGDGKGSFRTTGRYASATVRGTKWLTADRCDGTNVTVKRGVIQVADLPKHEQVTVPAGRSYLAKP
jgi:hypothetical protein